MKKITKQSEKSCKKKIFYKIKKMERKQYRICGWSTVMQLTQGCFTLEYNTEQKNKNERIKKVQDMWLFTKLMSKVYHIFYYII